MRAKKWDFGSIELMDAIKTSFDCSALENPMGETSKDALIVNFDRNLKLEFHGTKVTRDAGLLVYRELDEALGLTAMTAAEFYDNRKGKNTQHNVTALLRQSIYSRLAGYEETNRLKFEFRWNLSIKFVQNSSD